MKQDLGCGAILILCLTGTTGASAFELRHQAGGVDMQVNLGLIVQGAVYQTPTSDAPIPPILTEGRINAWGAFNAEWTSPTGWLFGAHIEGDTDQARSDTIKNDKIYVYIASDYGRLEVGREYGAARRLSYYAPIIGNGQIRGDFARYAGIPALLWPFGSRDAFKVTYMSPPFSGLRIGASWAPTFSTTETMMTPLDAVNMITTVNMAKQRNVFDLAAQYERPVSGWILGVSGSYVHSNTTSLKNEPLLDTTGFALTDPLTGKVLYGSTPYGNIKSWSVGAVAKHGKLIFSGAYVNRGDSNVALIGAFNHRELNVGVAWRAEKWQVGLSGAIDRFIGFKYNLLGLGGSWDINRHITVHSDVVYEREITSTSGDNGAVLLGEIEFHL